MKPIDLRSDTVTRPTPAMREAMARAEVGDDVFGEDPTVNRLQETTAALLGKEAALYVPSGTMANQLAVKSHTQAGDEVILEANSHVFNYESGGPAVLSAVQINPLPGVRGVFTAEQVEAAIRPTDHHFAQTRLVVIENTHNRAGGAIFPVEEMRRIRETADRRGLALHLDGARLWNASAATGLALRAWADLADSVSCCFSKGLGAPVGSCLAGTKAFIDRAHRFRKVFGGGMRQAGILAAAALYAVENHRARLADDHAHARLLAETISALPGALLDPAHVQTNILIVELGPEAPFDAKELVRRLKDSGVLCLDTAPRKIRLVTHLDVSREQVLDACERIRQVWK
ncbi:MAG: low-specificity L-threonine aldolase [Candidatus Zixiibacteriota bacterium]|nr:MAG: low-specificity L-threonine aldolase [candidate division Zixibacteria bacterium]